MDSAFETYTYSMYGFSVMHSKEGFPQGCPLSPLLACLVLHKIFSKLNRSLASRATARLDPLPPTTNLSYIDDTGTALRYINLPFYITEFNRLGHPHGIHLSLTKTKLLTSIIGTSPTLAAHDAPFLHQALQTLGPSSKLTSGAHSFGQPIDSHAFTASFLTSKLTIFRQQASDLHRGLPVPQTRAQLFRKCTALTTNHLLAADFYFHTPLPSTPSASNTNCPTSNANHLDLASPLPFPASSPPKEIPLI
jgi:hypothetical protein